VRSASEVPPPSAKPAKCGMGCQPPQKGGYGLRKGIEAQHRNADLGSWNQAQQNARVLGERLGSAVARLARRDFPYSATRISQSCQRPYSSTRPVSQPAWVSGSIPARFLSQNKCWDSSFIYCHHTRFAVLVHTAAHCANFLKVAEQGSLWWERRFNFEREE